jgi:MFS family permease
VSDADASTKAPAEDSAFLAGFRGMTAAQWKSGLAAWLGWLFDGLDMHLYTLVATAFVAQLLHVDRTHKDVGFYSSCIQAAFLFGWALGGGFFGLIGDRLGRSRALTLTILTYAIFTGLSFFAQTWWQLLIFRFVAALGIGGEWAVGASLLSETWPKAWRHWTAAVLQTAVNLGTMLASLSVVLLADKEPRYVFLVGVAPALLVLWIRKAVPETEEWVEAQASGNAKPANVADLFEGDIRRTTILTLSVCALSLTAHWAFMFWCSQHIRNLSELQTATDARRSEIVTQAMNVVMISSIVGNFLAAFIVRFIGYRRTISIMCGCYFLAMIWTYSVPRTYEQLVRGIMLIGVCQGLFALFTMYMPALFPVLLRTTGAGFCYNMGRIAAAAGTIFFGLFTKVGDYRLALFSAAFLFLPAAVIAWLLPEPPREVARELLDDEPVATHSVGSLAEPSIVS